MVSSTDGFCSVITFDSGELGEPYQPGDQQTAKVDCNGTAPAQQPAKQQEQPRPQPAQPPAEPPVQPQREKSSQSQQEKPSSQPEPQREKPSQSQQEKPPQPQQEKVLQPELQQLEKPPPTEAPRTPSRRVPLVTLSSPRQPAVRPSAGAAGTASADPVTAPAAGDEAEPVAAEPEPMEAEDDASGLVLYLEETTRELDEGPSSPPAAAEPPPPPSPHTPRRVPLVTLSSPKRSPKQRTPAKTDG